jgi:hypothetical protein
VQHGDPVAVLETGIAQALIDPLGGDGIERHGHRIANRVGRSDPQRREQVPLVQHRMARRHQ